MNNQVIYSDNLSGIAKKFDYFIIDLWGVLHDGTHPYDGAVECLKELKNSGKKIILLSNAPRKTTKAQHVLENLQFKAQYYDYLLTSGQATYDFLASLESITPSDSHSINQNSYHKYGKKYYYIGPEKDKDLLDGLSYQITSSPDAADFALVTGLDSHEEDLTAKLQDAEKCLAAKLPLICANPDHIVIKQTGQKLLCAGVIAKWYVDNGGDVQFFGKPHEHVYHRCMSLFGIDDSAKICAIGDSLHTDVAGANKMGMYSVLIAGGILANELMADSSTLHQKTDLDQALSILYKEHNAKPNAVIPRFKI